MVMSPQLAIRLALFAVVPSILSQAAYAIDPSTAFTQAFHAPVLTSLNNGIQTSNLHFTGTIGAYPLVSPPVNGFAALVAVTLTDQQGSDTSNSYAIKQTSVSGNPITASGINYTYLATLDSGAQSHILSAADAAGTGIMDSSRAGDLTIQAAGANGVEDLNISDPLGVFVTGANNVTVSGGAVHAPTSSFTGQIHTSVLSANDGSTLPSVIGSPIFGQYGVNILNSQTRRIVTPSGVAVRTPNVQFVTHGSTANLQYKLALRMQDPLSASSTDPAYIPSFENFDNLADNPSSPTFWSFPIANVNLTHTGGSLTQQPFLFDTGAQVTVLSEETADDIGFDVGTDTPAFTVDVQGVGGTQQVKGFFVNKLELPVTGGSAIFTDVPVIVLDVVDPRTGDGVIPGIIGMNLFTDRDLSLDFKPGTGGAFAKFSDPITPQWLVNANGTWLPDANWALGVPDGEDVPANFLGAATAARTVTVDGDYTIGSMKFDNLNSYTLSGTGKLTFATLGRPSKIEVVSGSHTVASPLAFDLKQNLIVAGGSTLTLSGDTTSLTSEVTKSGLGQVKLKAARYQSLAITAGSVQLISGVSATDGSIVKSLAITAGASIDLTNRRLTIDYDGASPLQTVRTDLAAGRITTSAGTSKLAIGYAEASVLGITNFGGVAVDATSIVMRLTLKGDANLSGNVNFDDLIKLAQNYSQPNTTWTTGDFNYNGITNFDDLIVLAQNYNQSTAVGIEGLGASFAADWALAQSLVPEPTAFSGLAVTATLFRRRR